METNCEMKQRMNMKENSTQYGKEILNESFFTRKPVIGIQESGVWSQEPEVGGTKYEVRSMKYEVRSKKYEARLASLAKRVRNLPTGQAGTNIEATTPDSYRDNHSTFFMKKILRRSGIFAIALLIANLFFASNAFGQNSNVTINTTTVGNSNGAWVRTGSSGNYTYTFTPNANSANLSVAEIVDCMLGTNQTISGGTVNPNGQPGNVTIVTARAAGNENGDVTFSATLTAATTSSTQYTFTVNAAGSISVNNAINFAASSGGTRPGISISFTAG